MSCRIVVSRGLAFGEARNTKIILFAGRVSAFYSNLKKS